ncbi:COG4315 family predicted lipoprotein [Streptomyces sp. DW26H14]|uniref:COG4315 family predicted lipoprotein n=1 Tax=Streptomyces sp. DW26H14 TaxID=3435395 RepID=UPI00403DE556
MAAFAAACGGGSDSAAEGGGSSPSHAAGGGASAPAAAGSGAGAVADIRSTGGDLGTHLVDGSGKTLYLFVKDKAGASRCTGDCAAAWPPVTAKAAPRAGSGVTAAKLTLVKRSDGTTQVAYAGHPLYYFAGDSAAGDTKGQGVDGFGAKWWLVGPDGGQITKTAAPTAAGGGVY